ncbi:MAG: right-handed parallel beta-helix repeat-containing protein [Ignavibacteriae bacterium]|nr:right-handed parallel beta-helix repeat-containing protein [Ignavibacteriota bacterium]
MKTSLLFSNKIIVIFLLLFIALLIKDTYAQSTPDLIYYKFENNPTTATTPNYAITGVGTNPAPLTSVTLTPGGQFDSCITGTGIASSGINTGWLTDLGLGSWTISMWLNNLPNNTTLYYMFGEVTGSFRSFIGGAAGAGNLILRGTGITDVLVTGVSPGPTVVHFVYNATDSTIKAYKNGVLFVSVAQATKLNLATGTGFKIGGYSTNAGLYGLMDEFRVYRRALTATEISASWNISLVPEYYNYTTGTSTSTYPFNIAGGKAINYVFLAGDFNQPSALPSWQQITKVYFNMNNAGTRTYTDFRILLAQSSITSLTSGTFYSGPYDTVYRNSSTTLTSSAGGWMCVALDKPFIYDATKSLVLFAEQCGATGSGGTVNVTSVAGNRRTWSVGGCPYVPSTTNAYIQNFGVDVSPVTLSGTYYIPSGNFPTIASAVSALNNCGISGAVTFNVAVGYTETTPAGGLVLGSATLNASTSATKTITFKKNGAGTNPLVTAFTPGTSTTVDGIWIIQGTDYVTIDGIDLQENASNTDATMQMEWGYALVKRQSVAPFDGCQYVTIKNCNISLNKANTISKGIYSGNHIATSTTYLTITATTDATNGCKFFGNAISNCYSGIYISGYSATSPYDLYDQFNEIGVEGGNTIRNFGGGAVNTYGIYTIYQDSLKVNNNNIGGGAGTTTTNYGIMISTSYNACITVYNNTVSDTTATLTSSSFGIALSNAGTSGTNNTVIVRKNTVQGMTNTSAATTAALYGFYIYYTACFYLFIDSNQVINNKWGNTSATNTGTVYLFYIYPYTTTPVANSFQYVKDNYTSGNKRIQSTLGTGTWYGMYLYYGLETVNIWNNTIENDTTTASTSTVYGMLMYNYYSTSVNSYNNKVRNIFRGSGSAGTYYGISQTSVSSGGTLNYYNNSVSNINVLGPCTIYGQNITSSPSVKNIYGDTVYSLRTTANGSIYGLYHSGGTTVNLYRNKIYDLRTSTGGIQGINISGGTTNNIYNNFISDLRVDSLSSSSLAIGGLYIAGSGNNNVYYNTVFLNCTSHLSGSFQFITTALYSSITPSLDLRNNIIVNLSTPGTTGYNIAYQRSSNNLTNYASVSDNNCLYAGTPSVNNLIFYDGGTNSIQTITNYRTLVTPRDASSFTELPPFINISTTPYNLHLNTTDTTQCEKGGIPITSPISITTDYDGNTRNASYPDVGADEFSGIPDYPNIVYTNLANTTSTSNYVTSNWATIRDISGINITSGTAPRLYYRKSSNDNTYIDNTSSNNGWKWVESPNTSSPFDFTIDYSKLYGGPVISGDKIFYFVVAQDVLGVPNVSVKSGTFASPPTSVALTSGAFPINGTVNYYMISSAAPLAGTYTVSMALFNKVTGKNLVPKEFTRKVSKEISTDEIINNESEKDNNVVNKDNNDLNKDSDKNIVVTKKVEAEEKYYGFSENGREYKGPTYIQFTPEIRQQYNFPDNYTGNYANISSAVADLNAVGMSASVTFLLLDANYGSSGTPEDFPITITPVTGASPTSKITIRPSSGITSTISGSSLTSIIKLDGADYVTIDGSNSGGTDKSLTIQNTIATSTTAAFWFASSGTGLGASNDTIKNCNISCNYNTATSYGIYIGGTSLSTAGADNDTITIQNNTITKAYYGIRAYGASTGDLNSLVISGNTIGSNISTDYITGYGIYGYYLSGSMITNNEIFNMIIEGNKYGMYFGSYVNNCIISKNKIHTFNHTNTSAYYCIGIYFASATSTNNQLDNNNICDLQNYGSTSDFYHCGIRIAGGSGYKLYYNSISLTGAFRNTAAGLYSKCLYVSAATTNLDIRNNIFYNAMTGTTPKTFAIDIVASSTFTSCNYNNLYSATVLILGKYAGVECVNLYYWQTATSQDVSSVSANPGFTSGTDLSIKTYSTDCWNINGGAYPLSSITTDIAGNSRSSTLNTGSADIGAYEFTPVVSAPELTVTGLPADEYYPTIISYAGTTLAEITWHGSNLPFNVISIYRPQVNPPSPTGNYANEYFQITQLSGSGFTYDIVVHYNLARQYTITSETDFRLAKQDGSWIQYDAVPNTTNKTITITGLNSFSNFSFGDATNPLPVNLKSFTSNVNGRNVKLTWISEKEQNNKGFEIQRADAKNQNTGFSKIGFINSNGNNPNPNTYNFNLNSIVEIALPKEFKLSQNYPNPFNPATKIDFDLPFDSKIRIVVYDMLGREVKNLVSGESKQAGYYTVELNVNNLASGTYFYRMIANSQEKDMIFTKKMVVLK